MFSTAIIVFREVFEAALVVGIVMAAVRMVQGHRFYIGLGIAAGVIGAILLAIGADQINALAEGMGQELLNASVLAFAVIMLAWHSLWMASHGRELADAMKKTGQEVASGERSLMALAVVVGVAILREGSETVLFLYGVAAGGQSSLGEMATGGAIGLVAGVVCGVLLYTGLARIPASRFFAVTNGLIILLAASMASQAAGFLVSADKAPPLLDEVWNTNAILSQKSLLGQILHALIGYDSNPNGLQVLAYGVTLVVLLVAGSLVKAGNNPAAASKSRVS